ncbi:MAG: type II toxin-antitoxin system VapC family toxin [Steroidobacteraceae bacterium]|jgi:tRNA(fMet)-specific endonuclease VapC|nr:type II toxin-antitoxin system VapC family toxin [Steroidobacteraceae bacterium]
MLDTDTCIALIERRDAGVLRRLQAKSVGQVGISSVTLAELAHGVARSSRPRENAAALQEFLLPLDAASFDDAAALAYGELRADLERRGYPIGPMDTMIAAHALALGCSLVTHNVREFERVQGLRVEDWVAR